MRNKLRVTALILGAAALIAGFASTQAASAAPAPVSDAGVRVAAVPNITGANVVDKSLTKADIKDGSLSEVSLYPPFVASMRTVFNGTVHMAGLDAELQAKVNAPDVDTKGDLTTVTFAPKVIQFIGGGYFEAGRGFTEIGTYTLPAGKWLVNTSVKFTRTVAGDPGVRPQVGLRVDQGTASPNWGTDLGTVGGEDISPVNNKDLWGQSVQSITTTEPKVIGVYGHGFTDTQGTADNQVSASVQVFLQRG